MDYNKFDRQQLLEKKREVEDVLQGFRKMNLDLAMSRGIPNTRMIELTAEKFKDIDVYTDRFGVDNTDLGTYNQKLIAGITEARKLFSELLCVPAENIIIGGNSSLNLMFDMFSQLMLNGNCDTKRSHNKRCPVADTICKGFKEERK